MYVMKVEDLDFLWAYLAGLSITLQHRNGEHECACPDRGLTINLKVCIFNFNLHLHNWK